jgi:hypothetical protein
MNANRGDEIVSRVRQRNGAAAAFKIVGRVEKSRHAFFMCAFENDVAVGIELFCVEMTMCVEQHQFFTTFHFGFEPAESKK